LLGKHALNHGKGQKALVKLKSACIAIRTSRVQPKL
jgi:hypothetical protein